MDQNVLRRELDNVKQCAASYGRPAPPATSQDMFSDDLAALKTRLRSMEASLSYLNASQSQREAHQVRSTAAQSVYNLPSLPSTLPSEPLFWQLFTSLRTDVRSLDSRVTTVEENLSLLEDRVDGLDQNRFTPIGSNASMTWASDQNTTSVDHHATELSCDHQQYRSAWYPQYIPQPGNNFQGTMQYVAGPGATSWAETANGVAFRDQEIARLEDILSRVQHDLQESEEIVNHKESRIEQLNYQQEGCHNEIMQLRQAIRAYNDVFAVNQRASESQEAECHGNEVQLAAAKRQIQELQETLSKAGNTYQANIDDALAEKEIDLIKLREFADRKDDVVRQQGDLIARGAAIIQERDDTIERLLRELKVAVNDFRNKERERERHSQLLEEKTQVIIQLEEALSQKTRLETPDDRSGTVSAHSTAQPETREPSAAPITPVAFGAPQDQRQRSGQWTPQKLNKYVKLPHEQRRAAAWETGPMSLDRGKFGQASQMSFRRSDSLKLLEKLALAEEGHRISSLKSRDQRYRLPLDDFESACEAPPALPPRLSRSHQDDGAVHSDTPSKHQHVHPKEASRSLQAYVEAEDNREKRGDAA